MEFFDICIKIPKKNMYIFKKKMFCGTMSVKDCNID